MKDRSLTRSTSRIVRHPVNREAVKKRVLLLGPHIDTKLPFTRRNLASCNSLKLQTLDYAAELLVLDSNSPDACRSLRIGAQAVAAIFVGAMATSDEVEVLIGEGPPTRVPSAVAGGDHVGNWTDGFFMAAICRENDLLESLCHVPIDRLRLARSRGPEDSYLFADALQAHWQGEGRARELTLAALQATQDPNLPAPILTATRELAIPTIEVLLRWTERHAEAFNESLARALELHRQYWGRERVANDPVGHFSLRLTGLAALAHDAGIPITVESDYLPMGLVRGDCRPGA